MAFPTVKKVAETLRIFAFRGEMLLPPPELFDRPIDLNSDAPPSYGGREQWMEINATGEMIAEDRFETLCLFAAAGSGGGAARPTSYLVAAGCFGCRRYLMVDKGAEECPLCKGEITTFESRAGAAPPAAERMRRQAGAGGGTGESLRLDSSSCSLLN